MSHNTFLDNESRARAKKFFPARLKELRLAAGLTQFELGLKLGVASDKIGNWERGCYIPRKRYLQKIAAVFNVRIEDLIGAEID